MAKSKNSKNTNYKNSNNANKNQTAKEKQKIPSNDFVMKVLVFLGVVMLFTASVFLMYYFFVKKSNIEINMSTDKKTDYITIKGEKELITTQKYVSDLQYSMRYDVNNISVFKYKKQDIFKFNEADKILVVVEKSDIPSNCSPVTNETEYASCVVKIDNYTEEHYFSTNMRTYKITIKTPNPTIYGEDIKARINYMLETFKMTSGNNY